MDYSSPEPQFLWISAIIKEDKITPQWLGGEAVDDSHAEKSSSVVIPIDLTKTKSC